MDEEMELYWRWKVEAISDIKSCAHARRCKTKRRGLDLEQGRADTGRDRKLGDGRLHRRASALCPLPLKRDELRCAPIEVE